MSHIVTAIFQGLTMAEVVAQFETTEEAVMTEWNEWRDRQEW